jgi:hypothetical protein
MACYQLFFNKEDNFFEALKNRQPEIVIKMVKCVISASKRKRDKIDIFEITFKDYSVLIFSVEKNQYREILENCLKDLIEIEEFELCADIKKILDKPVRKSRKKEIL